jgi:hypothetical protein
MAYSARASSALTTVVTVLIGVGMASAQSQPLPLPATPGGAAPPIYSQPSPTIRPAPVPAGPPREVPRTSEPVGSVSEDPAARSSPRVPQITSFPELTRGTGNSEVLLEGVGVGSSRR